MEGLKIWIVVALTLLSFSRIAAQNHEIDSLESAYKTAKTDSMKFDLLKTICFKIIGVDSAKTEFYCSLLIKEVEVAPDSVEKADAYAAIGDYYNAKFEFGKSLDYFHRAIELFRFAKSPQEKIAYAKCLTDYAYVFHVNGDFNTALAYYLQAESILDKYPDYNFESGLYNRLSDIYSRLEQPQKSDSYDQKAAAISEKISSPKMKALYYVNATYTLDPKKNFDRIRELLEKSLAIGRQHSLQEILWLASFTLGDCYSSRGDFVNAFVYVNSSLAYARKLSNKYDEALTVEEIGDLYLKQKNYYEAGRQFLVALELANQIKANSLEKDLYGRLASIETSRGNYKKAYEYLTRKEDAVYRIFDEEDQRQINFLNAKYESAKREAEIQNLTDQTQIQTLEIEKRKNLIYLFAAISILLLIAIYFIQRYYKSRKKIAEQDNQIQQQRIKELEKERQLAAVQYALQGEEKERSRLARDLHDGLGGLLSGTKMALGSFKEKYVINDKQADSFKHALDLLNKSIGELQRVAHNMMPQALVNGNIRDAVSEFCEKIDVGSSLSLKFRFFGTEEKIGQNYEIAIYRIVQELVNNIIKHSKATEALVQLVQEKGRASVTVQDNGKGFDALSAQASAGHGLKNIRLRVESLNGHFDVDSAPGKGTEVSIEFENPRN
jgi:two-component system NarL family sensor kinase